MRHRHQQQEMMIKVYFHRFSILFDEFLHTFFGSRLDSRAIAATACVSQRATATKRERAWERQWEHESMRARAAARRFSWIIASVNSVSTECVQWAECVYSGCSTLKTIWRLLLHYTVLALISNSALDYNHQLYQVQKQHECCTAACQMFYTLLRGVFLQDKYNTWYFHVFS